MTKIFLGYVDVYSNQGNIKSDEKEILKNNNTVVIRNIYISNSCTDFELRAYANLEGLSINCVKIKKLIINLNYSRLCREKFKLTIKFKP